MESESTITTCYRHPQVEAYVRCARCDQVICPDCMRDAAVGFHCVECVQAGSKGMRPARTAFGGLAANAAVPLITYVLIGVNLAVQLVELAYPRTEAWLVMLGGDGLGFWRTDAGDEVAGVVGGEWWRLLSGGFAHMTPADGAWWILDLAIGLFLLWRLGPIVETLIGRGRMLALYLLVVLGSDVAHLLVFPEASFVRGATAPVFGLLAAYAVLSHRRGADLGATLRPFVFYLLWLAIAVFSGNWAGYLGALLTGAAVAAVYAYLPAGSRSGRFQRLAVAGVAVLLITIVYVGVHLWILGGR